MNVLEEANDITQGARQTDYGHPNPFYKRVSKGWEVIFENGVTPDKIWLAMDWYKTCRELNSHKRDNITDKAGYARTGEMFYEWESDSNTPSKDEV